MKHFLHLLRHELLRLKWPLLCWLGLLLMELVAHSWQVFGPVGKNWPQQSGLGILVIPLYITLLLLTAALFLEHSNTGSRNAILTQPIPRFLFPTVKLTLLAGAIGLWCLQLGIIVQLVHGSEPAAFVALIEMQILPEVAMSLMVAWLAAQSQSPAGMAKHLALWTIGTYLIAPPIASFIAKFYVEPIGDWHLAALALAPPVIALHYLTRRPWPKIAASICALLLLVSSQYWPLQLAHSPGPQFPPEPAEVDGKATILSNPTDRLFDLRLRLEPGLLAEDEFALIANFNLITVDGVRLPRTAATWPIKELAELRRRSLERSENLETAARMEYAGPTGPKLLGGEAILRVFRLEPLPVILAPGQEEITFRIHGRNHHLAFRRTHFPLPAALLAPGFEPASERWTPWSRDLAHHRLTVIRGTEPGQLPVLVFLDPHRYGDSLVYDSHQFAEMVTPGESQSRDLTRKRLEFFEDRFVRVLRVRLIPSS